MMDILELQNFSFIDKYINKIESQFEMFREKRGL
jgi:hypothetical protein